MKAGSKRLLEDDHSVKNEPKKNRSDDEEFEIEELQTFGTLVTHMMEIENFFRLSMEEDNELADYFATAPEDYAKVKNFSKAICGFLKGKTMSHYRHAFEHMMPSQGYSMMVFLKKNEKLGFYLEEHIDSLDAIFLRYLHYSKAKLEAELGALSESNESHSAYESNEDEKLFWQLPINSTNLDATRELLPAEHEFPEDFKSLLSN